MKKYKQCEPEFSPDRLLNVSLKNFFVFHLNSMKLGEVLVNIDNYNFIEFE